MIPYPPEHMMFDGPQCLEIFKENGAEFLTIYKELCGLKPDETILDVGCGIGRKTIPLIAYLDASANYEGIDCTHVGIDWLTHNVTRRYRNFQFRHADVRAPGYNPDGSIEPCEFRFPYDDSTFDFVTVCSVFTHMQGYPVAHYLTEIHRVLKVGGRCLATFFLIDAEAEASMKRADPKLLCGFPHEHETGRMANAAMPEQAIAFYETFATGLYPCVGLTINRIEHGYWSCRPGGLSYQDIIIASKMDL